MRRRLFNLTAAFSLILCAAFTGLAVRSHWRADLVTQKSAVRHSAKNYEAWSWYVESRNGGLRLEREHAVNRWFDADLPLTFSVRPAQFDEYPYWTSGPPDEKVKFIGFQLLVNNWTDG